MKNLTATEAARTFSSVLDAVEHGQETFLIKRAGRVVARMGPATESNGRALKGLLKAHPPDDSWAKELTELRADLGVQERSWKD